MTFKLFGYLFGIEHTKEQRSRTFHNPSCKVIADGKYLFLTTPTGEVLPHQLSCTLIESFNHPPKARIELYVDLSDILYAKENDSASPHGDNKTE